MKIESMALTRPRISSGVESWTRVNRITTLIMSAAPRIINMASDRMKWVESPNTIVAAPNTATVANIVAPTRPPGCRSRPRGAPPTAA